MVIVDFSFRIRSLRLFIAFGLLLLSRFACRKNQLLNAGERLGIRCCFCNVTRMKIDDVATWLCRLLFQQIISYEIGKKYLGISLVLFVHLKRLGRREEKIIMAWGLALFADF